MTTPQERAKLEQKIARVAKRAASRAAGRKVVQGRRGLLERLAKADEIAEMAEQKAGYCVQCKKRRVNKLGVFCQGCQPHAD